MFGNGRHVDHAHSSGDKMSSSEVEADKVPAITVVSVSTSDGMGVAQSQTLESAASAGKLSEKATMPLPLPNGPGTKHPRREKTGLKLQAILEEEKRAGSETDEDKLENSPSDLNPTSTPGT